MDAPGRGASHLTSWLAAVGTRRRRNADSAQRRIGVPARMAAQASRRECARVPHPRFICAMLALIIAWRRSAMAACGRGVLGKRWPRLPMPASMHGVRHCRLLFALQAAPATAHHAAATAPAATQVRPAARMALDRRCERGSSRARLLARSVRMRCADAGDRRDGADRTGEGDAPRCAAAASPGVACAAACTAGGRAARRDVPVTACVGGRRRARQRWRRRAACRGRATPGGAGPPNSIPAALLPRASIGARGQGAARPACRGKVAQRSAWRRSAWRCGCDANAAGANAPMGPTGNHATVLLSAGPGHTGRVRRTRRQPRRPSKRR
jgi:hypothetical protein